MPSKKKSNKKKGNKKQSQKPAVNSTNQQEEGNLPTILQVNLDDAILVEDVIQGNNNEDDPKKTSRYDDIVSKYNANLEQPKTFQPTYSTSKEHVKFERDFSDFVNNNEGIMKDKISPEKKNSKKKQSKIQEREDMSIEDYVNQGIPREIVMMKHPLANKWVFWWFRNDKSKSWEQNQEKIAMVDTIEDFWQVHNYIEPASKLGQGCNYMVFKKGIQPDWEDFQNMAGGRWIANIDRNRGDDVVDDLWLEILFIMIGEHAGEHADMVNGAYINIRPKTHKLEMWLKDANNMNAVMQIGSLMKSRMNLKERIYFTIHREANKGNRSRYGSQNSPSKISIWDLRVLLELVKWKIQ